MTFLCYFSLCCSVFPFLFVCVQFSGFLIGVLIELISSENPFGEANGRGQLLVLFSDNFYPFLIIERCPWSDKMDLAYNHCSWVPTFLCLNCSNECGDDFCRGHTMIVFIPWLLTLRGLIRWPISQVESHGLNLKEWFSHARMIITREMSPSVVLTIITQQSSIVEEQFDNRRSFHRLLAFVWFFVAWPRPSACQHMHCSKKLSCGMWILSFDLDCHCARRCGKTPKRDCATQSQVEEFVQPIRDARQIQVVAKAIPLGPPSRAYGSRQLLGLRWDAKIT